MKAPNGEKIRRNTATSEMIYTITITNPDMITRTAVIFCGTWIRITLIRSIDEGDIAGLLIAAAKKRVVDPFDEYALMEKDRAALIADAFQWRLHTVDGLAVD